MTRPGPADRDGVSAEGPVAERLRRSGERVASGAGSVTGDLDDVVRRSRARRQRQSFAGVAAFTAIVLVLGIVGARRGGTPDDIFLGQDGRPLPASTVPSSTTTSTAAPATSTPPTSAAVSTLAPPCNAPAFADLIAKFSGEQVTRVSRYACLHDWATARVETQPGAPTTWVFLANGGYWISASTNAEADLDKLRQMGAPVAGLYQIMGLRLPSDAPPTPPTTIAGITIAQPDPVMPPAGALEAITRRFVEDVGPAAIQDGGGRQLKVYDGYLLTDTTARRLTDDERHGIEAALVDAGFTVAFVDITGFAVSFVDDASDDQDPALLFADPSIEPGSPAVEVEPGRHRVYIQISGCGRACGYGATYDATEPDDTDGAEGAWRVESVGGE